MSSEPEAPQSPAAAGPRRARRATSADVAALAGVSRATVSYVMNNREGERITAATRDRVRAAAERLGYTPSVAGRTLVSGRSNLVMLVFPDAPFGETALRIIEQMSSVLAPMGLDLIVHFDQPGAHPIGRLGSMLSLAAVVSVLDLDPTDRETLDRAGIPVVVPDTAGITTDSTGAELSSQMAAFVAVDHLVSRGHRHLAVGLHPDGRLRSFSEARRTAAIEAATRAGLAPPVEIVVPLDPTGAEAAVDRLLTRHPTVTAVAAYNDEVALAVLHGARRRGVGVPGRLAVIGIDDIGPAALADPPLTTVASNPVAMGRYLAGLVRATLEAGPAPTVPTDLLGLVVREST